MLDSEGALHTCMREVSLLSLLAVLVQKYKY
jgi:hypothetical protein